VSHDKARAAARERMAKTGQRYADARRAVCAEHQREQQQDPGATLLMSVEIHDWLTELRDRDPAAARATSQAIAALLTGGERRREPLAASTAGCWPAALEEALDQARQVASDRLSVLRRGQSDASELILDIGQLVTELQAQPAGQEQAATLRALRAQVWESRRRLGEQVQRGRDLVRACQALQIRYREACFPHDLPAAARLRDVITELERQLGTGPWPEGLSELGPGGPHDAGMRVLFAAEPPGRVLLLAVLDGPEAVRERHLEAVGAAADVLREVRAGQAPEATECRYVGSRAFLEEFCPGDGSQEGPSDGSQEG
jgi:hypothetical protein